MQFGWLFAIIIGGVILFLAVFFSGRLLGTGTYYTEADVTRNIDVMLNSFASIGKAEVSLSKPVSLPEKTEINFSCSAAQDSETISALLPRGKEPFFYPIKNKYIFSEDFNSKELWVFAKPFDKPWRVDDLIYIVSKDYCFINPPETIRKELEDLNSSKIGIAPNCRKNLLAMSVCFSGVCDIFVNTEQGYVRTKSGKQLRYMDDATMYAAIFGPKQYDCNIERLLNRLSFQTDMFISKASILSNRGCFEIAGMNQELAGLKAAINNAINNKDYLSMNDYGQRIEEKNKISCPLY